ncbi:MAG: hypothetical protein SF052_21120 [Bacteroidia bacterium]|nr:hypothetical protein [Bacteroidia bacterium]
MKKTIVKTLIPILLLPVFLMMSAFTGAKETISDDIAGGAYLTFAGKYGGEISMAEISSHKELSVAGCAAGSKIYLFTLHLKKDGKTVSFTGKSPQLSTEVLSALKALKKGDSFYFEQVKAREPEGNMVNVWSETFRVV